jgi:hypothetical protein
MRQNVAELTAAELFDTGIEKPVPQYDKYLNSGGDYVEKYLKYVRIFLYIIIFSHCSFC